MVRWLGRSVRLSCLAQVPTRTDPFHPQRVTSRWVGNLRKIIGGSRYLFIQWLT
jgi:hypothetical protein